MLMAEYRARKMKSLSPIRYGERIQFLLISDWEHKTFYPIIDFFARYTIED
jgi:hypothetical protein